MAQLAAAEVFSRTLLTGEYRGIAGRVMRNIRITPAGRAYLNSTAPECGRCGSRHHRPREIGIVSGMLVVCFGNAS